MFIKSYNCQSILRCFPWYVKIINALSIKVTSKFNTLVDVIKPIYVWLDLIKIIRKDKNIIYKSIKEDSITLKRIKNKIAYNCLFFNAVIKRLALLVTLAVSTAMSQTCK